VRHRRDPLVQPTTITKQTLNAELKNAVVAVTSEDKAVDTREIPTLLAIPHKMAPTLTTCTLRSLRELTEATTEEPIEVEVTRTENSSNAMGTKEAAEVATSVVEATTSAEAVEVKVGKPLALFRKNSTLIKK
jgi:hypothetical protein